MAISHVENIDCMIAMAQFPDKFFDLSIVDPPYGVGDFTQANKNKKYNKQHIRCDWNNEIPTKEYFDQLKRVSKNYIICGGNYYKEYITDCGEIIWDKGNNSPVGSQAEIFTTNLFKMVVIFKYQWTGFVVAKKEDNRIHPCQKPVALYEWLLKNYAKPGDKILDTHLGSGSSRIAAANLGFDFWGYEIDEDYFDGQEKRFTAGTESTMFTDIPKPTNLFDL